MKKRITIYIEDNLYENLKILAKKKDRSISWLINDLFKKALKN